MRVDRFKFQQRLKRMANSDKSPENLKWLSLCQQIAASASKYQQRANKVPKVEYPDLPVSNEQELIQSTIAAHQVVIIAGETGSGKTTQIPKMCLDMGRGVRGLIAHTQPRRLAARSVATRIAEELNTPLGEQVGFKIRFSDSVSENTYIKLMTDGMLLAEMQNDRFLNQYDTIIIDEAHERSLNIDFLLGYLKQLLPKRPDLKVIITSATIDPQRFSKHFVDAPIIEVSGRTYPVEVRYRDSSENDEDDIQNIISAVDELQHEKSGDILVFLSGERDIREAQDALQKQQYRNTEIVPLFARLSASEQNRIFQSHSGRRIVLATNVAETSLTVPGIKYVVDPGYARISRYSARSKVQRLPIEPISQASANQRAGRCGRTSDGICIRLYSEEDFQNRAEFTDPEILRTNLASVILQMLALGLGNISAFPFVQPPDSRNIKDGFSLLEELGAVNNAGSGMKLTDIGKRISRLPIDPRYARMVLAAGQFDAVSQVMVIAAGLSIQDPRERPQEKRQQADEAHKCFVDDASDFITLLNLWDGVKQKKMELSGSQLRKWCKTNFVNYMRMREWQDIVSQIKQSLSDIGLGLNSTPANYDAIHRSMATGLLSHIGQLDKNRVYKGARNSQFMIFPGSGMAKKTPKWIMAAELVETSKLFARSAARIDSAWLEPLAKHMVKYQHSEPQWSKKRGAVIADERVVLYGLTIVPKRIVTYSNIDPVVCHELFIREGLVNGLTQLNYSFIKHNQKLIAEVDELEQKTRRRDLLVSDDELVSFYQQRIAPQVVSEASFKKWFKGQDDKSQASLKFQREDVASERVEGISEHDFPSVWRQDTLTLPLSYHFEPTAEDDGVSVLIPLPVLNQVKSYGFDWLVPGLRHQLLVALIKALPKRLRRHFVPAPDYATACLVSFVDNQTDTSTPLLSALSEKLFKMSGLRVDETEWQAVDIPKHLTMTYKAVDENNRVVAQDKQLFNLQQRLQGDVKRTISTAATPEFERKGLTAWDFGALPEKFARKTGQFEVQAYPALQAQKSSVDIALFDTEIDAQDAHKHGVNALVKLTIPSPIKFLQQKLPNKSKLGLYFNPFGSINSLVDDCVDAAIEKIVNEHFGGYSLVRSEQKFTELCEFARANINDEVFDIAVLVEQGLLIASAVQKRLKGKVELNMVSALADIKTHLQSLVFVGFVSEVTAARLNDWKRYLRALEKRIEKLKIDPNKDRLHSLAIQKVVDRYTQKCDEYKLQRGTPIELLETRWMIEELRVSFFAQQLGTRFPISTKRIENHLSEF